MIENQDVTPDALRYWGGNITLQITNDGVIMVDAKYSRAHDDVVAKKILPLVKELQAK